MTVKKDDNEETDIKVDAYNEADEYVADAVPIKHNANEPPIPAGHSRFYCSKCHTPYDLPDKATSWRCQQCMVFNSATVGECEWCNIL
jgi:LSD1 subclass zinc finger protein